MTEPSNFRPQIDQVITEVHILLGRCKSRLDDTKGYSARYSLIHDLKYAYRELGNFEAFQARFVSGIDRNLSAGQTENVILSRALCLLGAINSILQNKDVSLQNYQQAMYFNLSEGRAFSGLAKYHYTQKDYKTAFQLASQAILVDPKVADAYATRGACLFCEDKNDEAVSDFKKAAALDPEELYYLTWLGTIYYHLNDYRESIEYYNKALELDPTYLEGFNSRGHVYLNMKMYASAIENYNQAARLDPDEAYKFTTTFGDVKPVNGFLLAGFIVAMILVMGLPLLIDEFQVVNRLIIFQIGGWLVLAAVFLLGNLRLKDLGLEFKNLFRGMVFTFSAALLLLVLGEVFKSFNRGQVYYYLPGGSLRQSNSFQNLLLYLLPPTILQELLCRGFLLPQLFLKLRGPYRAFSSRAISTTFSIIIQYEIIAIAVVFVDGMANILFALILAGYVISQLYFKDRNIFGTIGVTFFMYVFLGILLLNLNAFLFAQTLVYLPYFVGRLTPKPDDTKLKIIDERVNHDTLFTRVFDHPLVMVGYFVVWYLVFFVLNGLDDSSSDLSLSTIFFLIITLLIPLVGIIAEIVTRLRRQPAL